MGFVEYSVVLFESVKVFMELVDFNVFEKLLDNKRFEISYVVELWVRILKGWGISLRIIIRIVKKLGEKF